MNFNAFTILEGKKNSFRPKLVLPSGKNNVSHIGALVISSYKKFQLVNSSSLFTQIVLRVIR